MIKLYAVNINDPLTTDEVNILSSYLSSEKQAKIKRFYHFNDLKRSLIAEILVRWEISQTLRVENDAIQFDTNEYGKPFLRGVDDFHFNISHAGDWVVMASFNLPLGVDIEEIKPIEMSIAKRFFSESEYNDLMEKEKLDQLDYFFQLWSLKESFIKAEGKGLSIPLDSFSFEINEGEIKIVLHRKEDYTQTDYYFKMYDIDKSYKLALCTTNEGAIPREVIIKTLGELYQEALLKLGGV